MLEIIVMLLGMIFPNVEANADTTNEQYQTTVTTVSDVEDTGGNSTTVPPKN